MTELVNIKGSNLEALWRVSCLVDEYVEICQHKHLGLADAFKSLAPKLCELLEVEGIVMRSIDENLNEQTLTHGDMTGLNASELHDVMGIQSDTVKLLPNGKSLLVRSFEAAGNYVGGLAVFTPKDWNDSRLDLCTHQLHTACEELDNYVHMIQAAARKQLLVEGIQVALRDEVLGKAIDQAVKILAEELQDLQLAVLYFDTTFDRHELCYRVYEGTKCTINSQDKPVVSLQETFINGTLSVQEAGESLVHHLYGKRQAVKSVMVEGLNHQETLGMVILATERKSFNVFTIDVLKLFSGSLSQRLVDYNRERRVLERSFPLPTIRRLLAEPDYQNTYLLPRQETVAVLFADISSFTAISEQILEDPNLIGEFVDGWSRLAVDAVYANGGVFDKMIGDCIIGLFGPPFFDQSENESALSALRAAWEINRITAEYCFKNVEEELIRRNIQPGLGVATGINLAPMHVGTFGPNSDYTCFAQGMNNCARLQGVANFREILVSNTAYEALLQMKSTPFLRGLQFEGPREAKVKNVAKPLSFHSLTYVREADDRR